MSIPATGAGGRCRAVLGGTFDPVHRGHLHAARVGREALGLRTATLLPAARPWHRGAPAASAAHRCRMAALAASSDDLTVSRLEIERDGPSYTVDTLRELAGSGAVVWFIGSDALASVAEWHRAEELPALCSLLVFERAGVRQQVAAPRGFEVERSAARLADRGSGGIHFLSATMLDVSATAVRRAIAAGDDASALLPNAVWDYIRRNGLYGARRR